MNKNNQVPEGNEKQSKTNSVADSRQLVRDYIRHTFAQPAHRGDLLKVLKSTSKTRFTEFHKSVSQYLHTQDLKNSPYAHISEDDIRQIEGDEIKNLIIRESVSFENQVKTIKNYVYSEYTGFSPEQKVLFETRLYEQREYDIRRLMASKKSRIQFINRYLGDNSNIRVRAFDEVCSDIHMENPTEEQKEVLDKWIRGYGITEKDIGKLLQSMNGHSLNEKKSLIRYFVPTVSLDFLRSHDIIDQGDAINLIVEEIGKLHSDELTDVEIREIAGNAMDNWIQGDYAMRIDLDSLDDQIIEKWWNNKNAQKELSQIIESNLDIIRYSSDSDWDLEADSEGNLHTDFLKKMHQIFTNPKTGKVQVEGIDKFVYGSVLRIEDKNTGGIEYIQVVGTDIENDDGHEGMQFRMIAKNGKLLKSELDYRNYQDIPNIFHGAHKLAREITILTASEFDDEQITKNILPDSYEEVSLNVNSVAAYLDEHDGAGKEFGFSEGVTLQLLDEKTGKASMLSIHKIDPLNQLVTLQEGGKVLGAISFELFLKAFIQFKLKRLAPITNAEDFVKNTTIPGLEYHHGLRIKGAAANDDHGHGDPHAPHGTHDEYVLPHALTTGDGKGHILIKESTDNKIVFTEYKGKKEWKDIENKNEVKEYKGAKHLYTREIEMDYVTFAAYVKNSKLEKAVNHNPFIDQDNYTDELPFHKHPNPVKAFLNIGTVGELFKAFEMGWHAMEHTMEKGQKINASKFMYKMFGGGDNDFSAQILADYVESVGETIDKYKKKFGGFNNGMKKRVKCLHIIQGTASRPEEIAAALMVTVEGSGGLYMDNPFVGYAGSWMWFNSLVRAAGYPDPAAIKAEIAPKVKEVNAENPTEEMYIEQFLKKYGEGEDANPLLMAMGNYPKFRSALIEGRKKEMEKGERDANELLGADDRAQLGVNKMYTGEWPQVIGIYKSAISKYAGGPTDVIPWMWALSGATKVVHPNIANEFKNFTDAQGFTFHAIAFCRNPEKADLYKRVVRKVIAARLPEEVLEKYDQIQARVAHQFSGHHHRSEEELEEYNKGIMKDLKALWDTHGKVIHPALQGTGDSYLFEHMDDPDIRSYSEYLKETHNYRGSGGKEGFNKDYGYVDGYKKNQSFGYTDIDVGNTSYRVRDIERQLEWVRIHGQGNGAIDDDLYTHLFHKSILPFLRDDIRDIKDTDQRKATYLANYQIILTYIRKHIGGYDANRYNSALEQRYMQDLIGLGYDLSFETVIENGSNKNTDLKRKNDRDAAESSYLRFQNKHSWSALGEVADTKSRIDHLSSASNDSHFGQRKTA